MTNKKTVYTPEYKAKVAMEAIKETMTISELCSKFHLHSTQVSKWKKDLIERSKEIFEDTRKKDSRLFEKEKELEKIYNQVWKLSVENDWLKKKSVLFNLRD